MDCSATVFVDGFSNFSAFSVILLFCGCPECSSSSADTQLALKRECHSETAACLKERSPKASPSISGVLVMKLPSFVQNLIQLLDFALHCRQNETRSLKSADVKTVHVHSMVSCGRLMQ
jgi:hypothetical protein